MLEIARQRCPGVPLHEWNMVNFDLKSTFDVVTRLFSSIGYVKTIENLELSISCMARHLNPSGILVVETWFSPEQYWTETITANFFDEPDLKIAWMYKSEIEDRASILDINDLVDTKECVEYFKERHELGLFTHTEYINALTQAGLDASYDSEGLFGPGMYIVIYNRS